MRDKRKELKFDPDRLDDLFDEVTYDLIQSIIIEEEKKRSREVLAEVKVNTAIPKWISTGLLDGLEESERVIMTLIFEELLIYITDSYMRFTPATTSHIYTLAFPITRRLHNRGKLKRFSTKKNVLTTKYKAKIFAKNLIEDITKFYHSPTVTEYMNHLTSLYGKTINKEAEFTSLYVDSFTWKDFKKEKSIKISFNI